MQAWHTLLVPETLSRLSTSVQGLSTAEAEKRLQQFGSNQLQEPHSIRPWRIAVRQFQSLLILLLVIAAIISGVLGDWIDCLVISAIVILNAALGFYQEFSAEKSIAALKKMTAPHAAVRRDAQSISIPAANIVPGDILVLDTGDIVAADARLIEANSLRCVESALTGESVPVDKRDALIEEEDVPLGDRENMVFMGTHVAGGNALAVVVATGMNTEIGHIAGLIQKADTEATTPLQQSLHQFGRVLVGASLGIVALLFIVGLFRGMDIVQVCMTSISLAVAAVPEGLPAVVTIALALGVLRMARRRALVRRLPSVETLGSTSVICTDKTGTLTIGEMTVRELYVDNDVFRVGGEGYSPEGEIFHGDKSITPKQAQHLIELANVLVGSNNASLTLEEGRWKAMGDPTEGALLAAGHKAGRSKNQVELELPKRHEIPFDSDRKRRTVIRLLPDQRLRAFVNGAPEVLLQHCTHLYTSSGVRSLVDSDRTAIAAQNREMAGRALRVIGSAYRDLEENQLPEPLTPAAVERDLVFVGLAGMYDPPRAEAKTAVAKCRAAGIRVVMITGDHPHTALAVAQELGIASPTDFVIGGPELQRLSDEQLREKVAVTSVYARVSAEHKLRIIRAWKARNTIVAMTGDGVNDAPAVKAADVGIAMGRTGTEVTKQAADMIITDDNFVSIVAAVEEGRGVYDNIRKTLQYLLASNAGELLLMTAAILAGTPMPLLPIHLLWINLVTDGPPALCLAADPLDPDLMRRPPRSKTETLSGGRFFKMVAVTGLLVAVVALLAFLFGAKHRSPDVARTYAFSVLVFSQLLLPFTFRSETNPIWRLQGSHNPKLLITIAASFAVQLWIFQSPALGRILKTATLSWAECALMFVVSAVPLFLLELRKVFRITDLRTHLKVSASVTSG